jgi:DNA-binding response OmpR family regulator
MPEVLVVDDDPDIRMLLAFSLEDAGFTVRHAADGDAALEAVRAKAPDVMVLDVMMPGTDGYGVLRGMRAERIGTGTKVLMLTTKKGERDHIRGWGVGADDYLTKPYEPDVLIERVTWLLQASAEDLEARRSVELEKAALLDRLEAAYDRKRQTPPPDGARTILNRR